MAKVELKEACNWEGRRREAGEVIEVPDNIQELNSGWMIPTSRTTTPEPKPAAATKNKSE
jgi:hypothetical protein